MTCQCPDPGFCSVRQRHLTRREWELCSGNCPPERPCPDELRAALLPTLDEPVVLSQNTAGQAVAQSLRSQGRDTPCRHRGEEVGRVQCASCRGHVEVKILACGLHGRCCIAKDLGGDVKCCLLCSDHEPVPV